MGPGNNSLYNDATSHIVKIVVMPIYGKVL